MKKTKLLPVLAAVALSVILMLSGCSKTNNSGTSSNISGENENLLSLDSDDMFTTRDFEVGYDETAAQNITISDSNPKISITSAGTYIISGTASDGMITVDAADTDKVQIVLNGASITSKTSAALYIKSADKVFVTTVKGTDNTLANGGTFTAIDDNNIDGAVFSKSDITFNGEGTMNITSAAAHGIVGKDDVKFTSGTYNINCASHGVDANDSIRVANAVLNITSGKDGLHCENGDDDKKGYIYIQSGTLEIKADDDGIHAHTYLTIDGGTLNITAAEGLEATVIQVNDGTISITASDDGINAAKKSNAVTPKVEINGGKITIVMGRGDTDGIDSNGDIIINGGTVDVTGNSSFDYDGKGVINGGTVIVNGGEVTTLPNQLMGGGPGGNAGGAPNGMRENFDNPDDNDAITSATPDTDGSNGNSGKRQRPGGATGETPESVENNQGDITGARPQRPNKIA